MSLDQAVNKQTVKKWRLLPIAAIACAIATASSPRAEAQAVTTSPLMTNLNGITYYSSEQPFLDVFKTGGGWITESNSAFDTGEEATLQLDTNGWPTSVTGKAGQKFTSVGILLERQGGSAPYPGGQYVVLYSGQGTLSYSFDASLVSSTPGRDVISVNPSGAGIWIQIKATDPSHTGNYIRNIQVVPAAYEANLKAGQIFNPTFLSRISSYRGFRFMDWMQTNGSTQSAWTNRPHQTDAFWGTGSGVPAEVMVALLNQQSADGWFNMPAQATDDYVTQFATLVHASLNAKSKVYVEYSNEVWNFSFSQATYAMNQGQKMFPNESNQWYAGYNYYGTRFAQVCNDWKTAWGADASRVVCVLATQAAAVPSPPGHPSGGGDGVGYEDLNCPLAAASLGKPCYKFADAIAIAPYFGYNVPDGWTTQSDGGLASLFTEMTQGGLVPGGYPGGMIQQALDWTTAWAQSLRNYGVPLIAYEGGQSLVGMGDTALTNLYVAANRDPRMGTAYTKFLNGWKAAGGTLFSHYTDVGSYSQWGEWGSLENIMQTTSPKYAALTNFVTANPCWWSNCTLGSGSSASVSPSTAVSAAGPKIVFAGLTNGASIPGTSTVIMVMAADPLGIASITLKGDAKTLQNCSKINVCVVFWPNLAAGAHNITATAADLAGNQSTSTISITAP